MRTKGTTTKTDTNLGSPNRQSREVVGDRAFARTRQGCLLARSTVPLGRTKKEGALGANATAGAAEHRVRNQKQKQQCAP